jgi:23S rRNA (cytidine2498-2'-O)-methyltransferase
MQKIERLDTLIYQADPKFEDHLAFELGEFKKYGSLYFAKKPTHPVLWQRNIWEKPFTAKFDSINDAVHLLKDIQRNWSAELWTQFRRASLIAEKLPPISQKPKPFPWKLPDTPIGAWTLLDEHTLVASPECSSPFPSGIIEFEQDKEGPPSRAYLKLQEALVRARNFPAAGEKCFDAGASPGGWSWVLSKLGTEVIACDRSPLDEKIAAQKNIRFIKHDAFTLKPEDIGPVDWLFCDAACYPERLFEWIMKWLSSGLCGNFICTLKIVGTFDGNRSNEIDFETPRRFAAIEGSELVHLYHNKHELTWIKLHTTHTEKVLTPAPH